jgi:hypothetical protein
MSQAFLLPSEPAERERIADNLHAFVLKALPGKRLKVVVQEAKKRRSDEQNRYLWGVVYPTILRSGQLDGWTAEDLHEFFLGEVFGWETVSGFGRKRMRPIRRSSGLSTVEFADYVARIQRRMAELGVYVPDPNE